MSRDLEYENHNVGYDWQYPEEDGGGIKCKNYALCGTVLPKWWFECKGNYLCCDCHMSFGTWGERHTGKGVLEIIDNQECPICLDTKKSISQPNCDHTLCLDCFKTCYYGDDDSENEPKFPYPDIEDAYYDNPEDPRWEKEYPLIQMYQVAWDAWDHENTEKYNNQAYLRRCPLCRNGNGA